MLTEMQSFVNWVRRRNPDAHTWRDYRCDLTQFHAFVGEIPLCDVTFKDIDNFVAQQAHRGFKPVTINRRLAAITSLYTFLSDDDTTLACPVIPRRHMLREPQVLPRPLTEEEVTAFFSVIDSIRDRAMFLLMLRCGLRIGEVANLTLNDLYLNEEHPRMIVHGKGGKERAVFLSPQAEKALRLYLLERSKVACDIVFLSYQEKGLSTTAIHKRLMHYRDRSGVDITAHRLRHTFANDLINTDTPVTTIQKLLGHSWLTTTQTYVRANDRQVQADFYTSCDKLGDWHE